MDNSYKVVKNVVENVVENVVKNVVENVMENTIEVACFLYKIPPLYYIYRLQI